MSSKSSISLLDQSSKTTNSTSGQDVVRDDQTPQLMLPLIQTMVPCEVIF